MSEQVFDTAGVFDEDYLYFFAGPLEERGDAETGVVWELLSLEPGHEVLVWLSTQDNAARRRMIVTAHR